MNTWRIKLREPGVFSLCEYLESENKQEKLSHNLNYPNSSYEEDKQGSLCQYIPFILYFICAQYLPVDKYSENSINSTEHVVYTLRLILHKL